MYVLKDRIFYLHRVVNATAFPSALPFNIPKSSLPTESVAVAGPVI